MGGSTKQILAVIVVIFSLVIAAEGANETLKIISADAVLDNIVNGVPVKYDNYIIKGDLNLNQSSLQNIPFERTCIDYLGLSGKDVVSNLSIVSVPIIITNSTIDGSIYLNDTLFATSVDFRGSDIKGDVYFRSSKFNGPAKFAGARFNGYAYFGCSNFSSIASFWGSKFNGTAIFGYSKFITGANFKDAWFNKYADFKYSVFKEHTYFGYTEFIGPADFEHAEFDVSAYFEHTKFDESAYFQYSNFNGYTNFWDSRFNDNVFFEYSKFGEITFGNSRFNETVTFMGSIFNGDADFSSSEVNGDIIFSRARFYKGIYIGFIRFQKIKIDWGSLNDVHWDARISDDLIRNFKNSGQYEASDDVYYGYRRWRQDQESLFSLSKLIDILTWLSCGYGVRPLYTIGSGLVVLLAFAILFFLIIKSNERHKVNRRPKFKEAFWFSATILLSLPKELYPLKSETYEDYARYIKYLPILERLIGWGLMLLLITTLFKVMIRY